MRSAAAMPWPPILSYRGVRLVEAWLLAGAVVVALLFRPWSTLLHMAARGPWIAAAVALACLWAAQGALPTELPMRLSGACLLVLMFGWPLAVLTILPVALAGSWLGEGGWLLAPGLAFWNGLLPATAALALGVAIRRWPHVFVYILGRAFLVTAVAVGGAGALRVWLEGAPPGSDPTVLLTAGVMIAWGEAFVTGALAAIFVAFRPQWLLTYSDARYLPRIAG
jgi:uncharacterized membrane protein